VPVEAAAGPVIPHRGPRIRVRGRLLDVAQRDPGVQRGGDERMPQRVGRDCLGDPGAAGGLADDPPSAVPVQPPAVRSQEDRPFCALADGQVDRPGGARRERNGDDLAALIREWLPVGQAAAAPAGGCRDGFWGGWSGGGLEDHLTAGDGF
jgi:hypothetical protein